MRRLLTVAAAVGCASLSLCGHARELETVESTRCSEAADEAFYDDLDSASGGCSKSSSYNWIGNADPTDKQREQLCGCDVDAIEVPDCTWKKLEYVVTVAQHVKYVFNCTGKTTPKITILATTSPTPLTSSTMTPLATLDEVDAPRCTDHDMIVFVEDLNTASGGCTSQSSYDWAGSVNPTAAQYGELCKCSMTGSFAIPNCKVRKGTYLVGLETHYEWVFDQCSTAEDAATSAPGASISEDDDSSSSTNAIVGGISGCTVFVAILLAFSMYNFKRKRAKEEADSESHKKGEQRPSGSSTSTHTTISTAHGSVRSINEQRVSDAGKWDDPVVMAVRIPHDSIFYGPLLSRGGFGEVYRGTYRGETVAIKQLLPEKRKDLAQIDGFLGEVKLMANLEHERIVKFIGVAWNSLSDACMVVEFMENGDLRSVLNRWDHGDEKRSNGFDADKIKIALHVAHALVYLHSLQPAVVHRDLKSKNILLDANMDAKLTDFGISRERADSTMTAGVGSSLWMAPEVMMGERYNEKADIFSFGVVLSELDTHQLPYFHAKEATSGQRLPETAILQQVMLGRLSVGFTDRADPELVQLGRDCVALDAATRPTAAMVLYRVHQALKQLQGISENEIQQ